MLKMLLCVWIVTWDSQWHVSIKQSNYSKAHLLSSLTVILLSDNATITCGHNIHEINIHKPPTLRRWRPVDTARDCRRPITAKFASPVPFLLIIEHCTTWVARNKKKGERPENLLDPKGSRMMPPPGLQIYLWLHLTLTFDLLIPKVDRIMSLPREPLVPIGIEIGSFVYNI